MKENQQIEWKETWRDEYLKWICGFANAEGGILVVGRNDKGVITGLPNAAKLLEDIPNKVRDILGIMVKTNLRTEAGKEYLEIVVEPYPYPVSYRGEYHYRSGSTKQELKGAALDKFLLRKQGRRWDAVPVPGITVKALDHRILKRFRERAARSKRLTPEILRESDASLIDKLHLKDGNHLKRAALLLFHPDPECFVTGAFIKIGRFQTNSDLLYHDEVHGDLFTQMDKTMDLLLTKYLRASISYDGLQRDETYPVPEEALREVLLNAIAHKDYSSGVPIQISLYDDKILFWNNGELHPGWTVETLTRKHSSQPFNPDLANTFFRAGMIEAWGRGIERIIATCKTASVPPPMLRYENAGLWVEFPLPPRMHVEHGLALTATDGPSVEIQKPSVKTPEPSVEIQKPSVKTPEPSVEIQKPSVKTSVKTSVKILQLLGENPQMSLADVAKQIGKSLRAIELASSKLVKTGRLRYVGPQKGGHWEVLA